MSFIPKNYVKGHLVDNTNDGASDPAFLLIGQESPSKIRFFLDKDFPEEIVMYADVDCTPYDGSLATLCPPNNQKPIAIYDFVAERNNIYFFESITVSVSKEKKSIFQNNTEGSIENNSDYFIQNDCVLTRNFDCTATGQVTHWDSVPMGAGYTHARFDTIIHAKQNTGIFNVNSATQQLRCDLEESGLSVYQMLANRMLELTVHFKDNTRLYQSKSIESVDGDFCIVFEKKKGTVMAH